MFKDKKLIISKEDKTSPILQKKNGQSTGTTGLYAGGQSAQFAMLLPILVKPDENAELWNDWATVQLIRGMTADAEQGYRRALEIDPSNEDAALNFGILLAATGHEGEATPLLQHGVKSLKGEHRQKITKIIDQCKQKAARATPAP